MTKIASRKVITVGLLIAVAVALLLSPFASQSPDGLEKVAEDKGFLDRGEGEPALAAPAPDYTIPGVDNDGLSTALAGLLGTLLTFGFAWGAGRMTTVRTTPRTDR